MSAKLAPIKKGSTVIDSVPVEPSTDGWELRETFKTWDEADRLREAIINNSQKAARVRYEQPNYLVEWRS